MGRKGIGPSFRVPQSWQLAQAMPGTRCLEHALGRWTSSHPTPSWTQRGPPGSDSLPAKKLPQGRPPQRFSMFCSPLSSEEGRRLSFFPEPHTFAGSGMTRDFRWRLGGDRLSTTAPSGSLPFCLNFMPSFQNELPSCHPHPPLVNRLQKALLDIGLVTQSVTATSIPAHATSTWPSSWPLGTSAEECATTVSTTQWGAAVSSAKRFTISTRRETSETPTSVNVSGERSRGGACWTQLPPSGSRHPSAGTHSMGIRLSLILSAA